VNSYAGYGFESTYGTGVAATRPFGHGTKISWSLKNNLERIYGIGSRNATATAAKKFEGTVSVDTLLSHATWFRAVLGAVTDGGGGGPTYTHTYGEANSIPSFTLATGSELGDNDEVTTLLGCKINTCTLTAAVNEVVKVRMECPFKSISVAVSGIGSAPTISEDVFTFANGTLELPSGSTIGAVQNFELTFNNTLEMLFGIGSRTASAGVEKIREYNIKMTVAFNDVTTLLTKFLGDASAPYTPSTTTPAAQATLVLTFTNGAAAGALRSLVITIANVFLDEDTLPKDPNEVIKEDVTGWAHSLTSIIWTNATSADNASP
jgi:hypothetical protein